MELDASSFEESLLKTLRQPDLNPADEADFLRALQRLSPSRWTSSALGRLLGLPSTYIDVSLELCTLPELVFEDLRQGHLTRDQAIELLRLSTDKLRRKVAREIILEGLSLLQTRQLVNGMGQLAHLGAPRRRSSRATARRPRTAARGIV